MESSRRVHRKACKDVQAHALDHAVGDADTEAVANVASWITPVPGGVGPVTVAMLMRNAAQAFKKQVELGWTG